MSKLKPINWAGKDNVYAPMKNFNYKKTIKKEFLISSPDHYDNETGRFYQKFKILWADDTFVLYGNKGNWPNLHKWESIRIKPLEGK